MTRRCTLCGAPAGSRGARDGHLGPGVIVLPLCDTCADDRPVELLAELEGQDRTDARVRRMLEALLHPEATQ